VWHHNNEIQGLYVTEVQLYRHFQAISASARVNNSILGNTVSIHHMLVKIMCI